MGASLAPSTYQAGKLFLLGLGRDGRPSTFERTLERCMALHVEREGAAHALLASSLWQVWRFADVLRGVQSAAYPGHDRLFAPRRSSVTGDLDVHEIARDADGRVLIANTLLSCVAALSDDASFEPLRRPPCVSRPAPGDRCHLNGFCLGADGRLSHATAVAAPDVADG